MKISTKGRYGLRAAYELAQNYNNNPVTLKTIAERQNIPERYLQHIMVLLRKEGIVRSSRGVQGGYRLTKDPAEISVGQLIRILEGPIFPLEDLHDESETSDKNVTVFIWKKLKTNIEDVLDSITLKDLCEEGKV